MLTMVKPGALVDLASRAVADALKAELGEPVLVTNTPGGSHGSVMATELSNAKADGYTLGIGATAAYTYSPHFLKTRYTFDDFEYLTLIGLNPTGIVCRADRPWKNLKDAFDWAKKENKGLTFMFHGSDDRDVMKRIAAKEGVKLSLMPSTGGPSIVSAVLGGHADLGHLGAIMFEYVNGKKVNLLAATTPVRIPQLPEVSTLKEQGWNESVEMFVVMAAPKGMPDAVLARLEKAIDTLAKDETFMGFLTDKLKMGPVSFGKEEATAYMVKANDHFKNEAMQKKK
jgi:tripartite-type tricarboxylate transporter receptor subunit TctC